MKPEVNISSRGSSIVNKLGMQIASTVCLCRNSVNIYERLKDGSHAMHQLKILLLDANGFIEDAHDVTKNLLGDPPAGFVETIPMSINPNSSTA
ncbi:hypothetical protein L1987_01346 [Smallanthus sonchifolius]|uniref:Uncharacterized protein n=1 Tax=Smallanthus sonchifolius TaxID=185202 RepID=A0ACB9K4T8_9ASTR|nr:hypothetical protein L1987_01346 [Smallanthus sonchifolius]